MSGTSDTEQAGDDLECYEYVHVALDADKNVEIPRGAIGVNVEYHGDTISEDWYEVEYLRPVERDSR